MELSIRLIALALTGCAAVLVLRKHNPELALLAGVAVCVCAITMTVDRLRGTLSFLRRLTELTGVSAAVISAVLKAVGIAVASRLSGDICKDAGENAAAYAMELAGAACALWAALPLFETLLTFVTENLGK